MNSQLNINDILMVCKSWFVCAIRCCIVVCVWTYSSCCALANPTFLSQFLFLFVVKRNPVHICFSVSIKSHSLFLLGWCWRFIINFLSFLRFWEMSIAKSRQLVDLTQSTFFAFGCFLTDAAEEKLQLLLRYFAIIYEFLPLHK